MPKPVLHGWGKPRIILRDSAEFGSGTVASLAGLTITTSDITYSASAIGKKIVSENKFGEETWGKIVSYDGNDVTVDFWTNLAPEAGKAISVKDTIIDLPYCESLIESFTIDSLPPKKLYSTGRRVIKIRGFYYYAQLNYTSFADRDLLTSVQGIYDSARTASFEFIPRRDNPNVSYDCEIDPEQALTMRQLSRHQGHGLVQFFFQSVERITKPDLTSYLVRYLIKNDWTDYVYQTDGTTKIPLND